MSRACWERIALRWGNLRITLRTDGDSAEQDARSLYEWLLLDRGVRRDAHLKMTSSAAPIPGQQGALLDVVSLTVGTSISAGSLGVAIASWRSTRPQEPTVTVERPDGHRVTVSGMSRDEAQRMVEQLRNEQRQS
ncbi:effector-associated constant component EACC1 [Streptomyces profundus]|uniref:effector-associated constant component EACC1 n=1 Tax=Streptomyces profundus TaxID=2867410 RepID=UPI003CC87D42